MDKITKLPWNVIEGNYTNHFGLSCSIGTYGCNLTKADSEYLCRAVNSHEGLVEIAKAYLKTLNSKFLDYQKIEKIIKAANGE